MKQEIRNQLAIFPFKPITVYHFRDFHFRGDFPEPIKRESGDPTVLWQGYLWIIYCIIYTIISMNALSSVLYSTKVASVLGFSRLRSSATARRLDYSTNTPLGALVCYAGKETLSYWTDTVI